jgi:hypothetical protein
MNGMSFFGPEQEALMTQRKWIPFDGFSGWLHHGKLFEYLQSHAPHLAADYAAVEPKIALRSKDRLNLVVMAIALVPLFIALVIVIGRIGIANVNWERSDAWIEVVARLFLPLIGLMFLIMVPLLAYRACCDLWATWKRIRAGEYAIAGLCVLSAAVQLLFATLVVASILNN